MRCADRFVPRFHSVLCLAFALLLASAASAQARTPVADPGTPGVLGISVYAIHAPYLFQHDAGRLVLQVTNLGIVGNPYIDDYSAAWRGGEYLFSSSPWIGAYGSDDQPHVSTGTPSELRPSLDSRSTIYESFQGTPHGERPGPGTSGDDDHDSVVDEDFQDGFDDDGDGKIDEDFAAAGSQMLSCVYQDDTPEAIAQSPDHVPLGVLVRQRSFQWSTDGINEFIGFDFQIINHGDQHLHDIYLGIHCDSDIGPRDHGDYWSDDLVGWARMDTTVSTGLPGACSSTDLEFNAAFMWDAPDLATGSDGGDVPGVFGTVILGHPTDGNGLRAPARVGPRTIRWFLQTSPDSLPNNDPDRYQLMALGGFDTGNPRPGVAAGSAADPGDYSHVSAAGPFQGLEPGESVGFQMAYVIGDGFTGFRENSTAAAMVYRGAYVDADQNPTTGIDGKETCLRVLNPGEEILWDDPCDTSAVTITIRSTACTWVDGDCDPCTGVSGQEAVLRWVGNVAPPDPLTNLDPSLDPEHDPNLLAYVPPAGNGEVTLQWDNRSECYDVDAFSGLRIFEGYRVWKVADWQGDWVGPGDDAWTLVAEYRENPAGGAQDLRTILDHNVGQIGVTEQGCPLYPIGRYTFVDTAVVNGTHYRYAVTAFGALSSSEFGNLPNSPDFFAVTPCDTCGPTPVRLSSFTAERVGVEALLRWRVAEATDHAGFLVYRREPGGERVGLSVGLLAGRTEYDFRDPAAPLGMVEYWLAELSRSGNRGWIGPAVLPAAVGIPAGFTAGRAVPNPSSGRMSLSYSLPETRAVRVTVHDLQGRVVRTLVDEVNGPGTHTATWAGRTDAGGRAAAGWYLIKIQAGGETRVRRAILLE